ncbi:MAG: exo-alpha-sialidase, partial [Thermoplasmata archaeon]|nr:exo-alpha-sialidase [Thermoplasmata archaeon]
MLALLAPVCHSADEGEETTGFPAGWSEDIRLTYTDIICRDPDVAVSGDCVYVVWRDSRSGSHEVYFKKSEDGGVSWSQDVKISNSSLVVEGPHLEVNGNHIHVVWGQYDMRREVHYRNSTDGVETWNLDVRLSKLDNSPSMTPVFTVDGNNIHVIWTEEPNFCGLQYIYYRNSTNGGNSWNSIQNITDYGYDWGTCIAANGLYVHVMHVRWVPNEMFYIRSTDGGITWEPEQQLSPIDVRDSWQNSIAVWQDNVHLVFGDTIDGSNEVHYMNSTDNGMTWETHPGKRISDIPDWSFLADMAIDENTINVVWGDSRDLYGTVGMPFEIYLTNSTDGGITWSLNVRLTFAENSSANPSIAMVNGKIHVVWVDNRDLGRTDAGEIYYKRYPEFPTDTIGPSIYHNPVVTANGRLPIPIYANITDDGWGGVDEVTLFYKNIGDLEYSNTSMGLYDRTPWNGTWNGEIPKQNK